MKNGWAAGPTGLKVDLIEAAGKEGVVELTGVLKLITLLKREMLGDWKRSYTLPLLKGKGNVLKYNYRWIRLLMEGIKE